MRLPNIAGALLLAALPAAAQESAERAGPAPPDCWVAHAQVQPSRSEAGASGETDDAKALRTGDKHAGAEHLPRVVRLPPCGAQPARDGAAKALPATSDPWTPAVQARP